MLTPTNFDGCMEAQGTKTNNKIILGKCDSSNKRQKWIIDGNLIRLAANKSKCLQAGYKNRKVDDPENGMKMRVGECDDDFGIPRQIFEHDGPDGKLTLVDFPKFCVVSQGAKPIPGKSSVILKVCNDINRKRRGWEAI